MEAVNDKSDGEIYVAIFSGPEAEQRAKGYAALMNSGASDEARLAFVKGVTAHMREADSVELSRDGNQICALIGPDLQEGVAGFGGTTPAALRDLAKQLEEYGHWPLQE